MLYLHWKKIIVFKIGLFIAFAGFAQKNDQGINYQGYQSKPYYFGLSLGLTNSKYRIFHSRDFVNNDSIKIAESSGGPGLLVGIVTNLKIGDYFDLRMIPTFNFAERNLTYRGASDENQIKRSIESVFFDMPFQVRYKSAPYKDVKMYVMGGFKYSFDIQSKSRTKKITDLIKISPHDFAVEAGVGMQFFLPFFIFSPEIKISQGIGNVLLYKNDLSQSTVLDKLLSRTFTISFHLEG